MGLCIKGLRTEVCMSVMSPLTFRLHLLSALIFDVLSFNFKYKAEVEIFHTLGIFLLLFLFSPTAFICNNNASAVLPPCLWPGFHFFSDPANHDSQEGCHAPRVYLLFFFMLKTLSCESHQQPACRPL